MALAVAFDDAKTNQVRREGDGKDLIGGALSTPFFVNSPDNPDLPFALLSQLDPGRFSCAHFHTVDQFQVVVDGKGKLGRNDLTPYCVHFSRAYTPYGPLTSDASTGLDFYVMRAHYDPGSQSLSENEDKLKLVPDRRPWQNTRRFIFPVLQSGTTAADSMLQAVPGIEDENGLAAYTLSMKPNAKAVAPDPTQGDGQFLVAFKGSLFHRGKELTAPTLVFVYPKEGPFLIHAGAGGLEALVLNFPRPSLRTQATPAAASAQTMTDFRTWQCALCAFVYDEAAGLPEEGIPPGTRWKDVPETWTCPDCSSSKGDFQMIELEGNSHFHAIRS